jgi:hypothetical protein
MTSRSVAPESVNALRLGMANAWRFALGALEHRLGRRCS